MSAAVMFAEKSSLLHVSKAGFKRVSDQIPIRSYKRSKSAWREATRRKSAFAFDCPSAGSSTSVPEATTSAAVAATSDGGASTETSLHSDLSDHRESHTRVC